MRLPAVWKISVCVLLYLGGVMLGGALLSALGLEPPAFPMRTSPQRLAILALVATTALAAGLTPLARGLRGRGFVRFAALLGWLYASLTVNTVMEMSIFTTVLRKGGAAFMLLQPLLPDVLLCAALAHWFRGDTAPVAPSRRTTGLAWRIPAAIVAFPAVYYLFGMCVGPFVLKYYDGSGPLGFTIPPQAVILRTQLIRSAIFLAATMPILTLWTGSARRLAGALGLAFTVAVGLYGTIQGDFMPATPRILHSLEIAADSLAYAGVLAYLFAGAAVAGSARARRAVAGPHAQAR